MWRIVQIFDGDYGCEELLPGEKPQDSVILENEAGEQKIVTVDDEELCERGISEGDRVCISADGEILKYVRVVAAVIRDDNKVFATARGYGAYKGMWEFPGGKTEPGETPQEALKREIREELTAEISVGEFIKTIEYDYPDFHLSMDCFWAKVISGKLELKEAEAGRWLSEDELYDVDWLPADMEILDPVRHGISRKKRKETNNG